MGGVFSGLTPEPWRSLPESYGKNLEFLKNYQTQNTDVRHLRILLIGPAGAGKSSFINSVDSIFQNRITAPALTAEPTGFRCTRTFKTYNIRKDSRSYCSFVLNDTMGFEPASNFGIHEDDLKLVLRGHVREGSEFHPERRITDEDPGYNPIPSLEDRVHVLVHIVPSNNMSVFSDELWQKMREVREAARHLEIPQLIIITKVDEHCPETKQDINHAYRNEEFEVQVKQLNQKLGIPQNCIFFLKNYISEMKPNPKMNAVILAALRRMVEVGDDFLKTQRDD